MALFKTRSAAVYGIDAHLIGVEVDLYASGNPKDSVAVGMPDVAVRGGRLAPLGGNWGNSGVHVWVNSGKDG
jgi:hypothetical protein